MTDERERDRKYARQREQARILQALVDETTRHNAELTRLLAELEKHRPD